MLCQFERLIYPQKTAAVQTNSYMIAIYRPCETIKDTAGNTITQVKAVGYCLPTADTIRYELQGRWAKNPKHGVQFEVENYDEVIIPTKEGIIAYLTSGQIKGIGPKLQSGYTRHMETLRWMYWIRSLKSSFPYLGSVRES